MISFRAKATAVELICPARRSRRIVSARNEGSSFGPGVFVSGRWRAELLRQKTLHADCCILRDGLLRWSPTSLLEETRGGNSAYLVALRRNLDGQRLESRRTRIRICTVTCTGPLAGRCRPVAVSCVEC